MLREFRGRNNLSTNIPRNPNKPNPNVLSDQSNSHSISKYFKETKKITPAPSELSTPMTSKRLQDKYDNFNTQPVSIPERIPYPQLGSKRENQQHNDRAQHIKTDPSVITPPNKIRKRFSTSVEVYDNTENTSLKKFKPSVIHLIGYVENALNWYGLLKTVDIHVIYNVIGNFINVVNGSLDFEKYVFVRGVNGCIMECRYFEVECSLPYITKGQSVACLGYVTGEQKFALHHIYALEKTTNLDIQRAIFLCQRLVSEYAGKSF